MAAEPETHTPDARALLVRGCELLAAGNAEAAGQALRAGLHPDLDWNAPTGLALRQRLREAEALLRGDLVGRAPLGTRPAKGRERTLAAEAHYDRGVCRIKIGQFSLGVLDLARALELDAGRAEFVLSRTTLVGCHVQISRCLAELNTIVSNRPRDPGPLFLRALYIYYWDCCRSSPRTKAEVELGLADLDGVLLLCPDHASASLLCARLRSLLR